MEELVHAYLDRGSIVLMRREPSGRVTERRIAAEYVSYHRAADVAPEQLAKLQRWDAVCVSVRREGEFLRVGWRDRNAREALCRAENEDGVENPIFGASPALEGDVHPVRRFLADNDVKIQRPRRAYFDLETDSRVPFSRKEEMRVLSWAMIDDEGNEWFDVLAEDNDRAEKDLLLGFFDVARQFDQLCAWNGDGFDFPVLAARAKARALPVNLRRWLCLDQMAVYERNNRMASKSGDEKTSMRLEDVAQAQLGYGKAKFNGAKTYQAWKHVADYTGYVAIHGCPGCGERHPGKTPRQCMVDYNLQDVRLLRDLEKKLGYVDLLFGVCEICGLFPDSRGLSPSNQVDAFMLRLGRKRGLRFPTARFGDEELDSTKLRGAYRTDPTILGIVENEHVIDFERQYPSMVLTYNLSPETMLGRTTDPGAHVWERELAGKFCTAPGTGVSYRTDVVGVLPSALLELIELRKVASKRKAECAPGSPEADEWERKDAAYKVIVNSFPGVLGLKVSRFFDVDLYESVTQSSAWYIKHVERAFPESGPGRRVNCVDTDGCFCVGASREEFRAFVKWCNEDLFPRLAKEHGAAQCFVRIEYEKAFSRIVHVAATRYFGRTLFYKKAEAMAVSRPEIKGIEWRRGDWPRLARQTQERIIRLVLGDWECETCRARRPPKGQDCPTPHLHAPPSSRLEDFHAVLAEVQRHVMEAPLAPEDIVVTKALSKPLKDYVAKKKKDNTDAALPRHVEVAKVLEARGQDVSEGTRIAMVVADEENKVVIPASDYDGTNVDRHHVWEKLVAPPAVRLLAATFPDHDWSGWEKTRPTKARTRALAAEAAGQLALVVVAPAPKKSRGRPVVAAMPARGILDAHGKNEIEGRPAAALIADAEPGPCADGFYAGFYACLA